MLFYKQNPTILPVASKTALSECLLVTRKSQKVDLSLFFSFVKTLLMGCKKKD